MLKELIEAKWFDCFTRVSGLRKVEAGESAAILSESRSHAINVEIAKVDFDAVTDEFPTSVRMERAT